MLFMSVQQQQQQQTNTETQKQTNKQTNKQNKTKRTLNPRTKLSKEQIKTKTNHHKL